MSFQLVPKSVTLNDLERRNGRYFALFHRIEPSMLLWPYLRLMYVQRIRGFTTMRYINLRFTYLLTYSRLMYQNHAVYSRPFSLTSISSEMGTQDSVVTIVRIVTLPNSANCQMVTGSWPPISV